MAQGYSIDTREGKNRIYPRRENNYPKNRRYSNRPTKNDFFADFAAETDIFTAENAFPDWVYDFREDLISKLSPSMKKVCRNLKDLKVGFKIKYPVEIFGKWKFADVYIPSKKTVIMVLSSYKHNYSPCNVLPERAEFFKDKFRVIDLYEYNAGDIDYLKRRLMM